jgi:glycosyltransferase involved in cell wall biosynthesis
LDKALEKHHWIPALAHDQILQLMRTHDALVFPSLSDGFGMVLTEALSQGLPVIATHNSCGPDIIEEGGTGFVVPIRDAQAIAEKLELLDLDRDRLDAMKRAAFESMCRRGWEQYRLRLREVVASLAVAPPKISVSEK